MASIRRFFTTEKDYIDYMVAEKKLLKEEQLRVHREARESKGLINAMGLLAVLFLPKSIWWTWDFKYNPCKLNNHIYKR